MADRSISRLRDLEDRVPLRFRWHFGPQEPPLGAQEIVFFEDSRNDTAKILMKRSGRRFVFGSTETGEGGFVPTSRLINTGTGITGGGDLSADRTLSIVQGDIDHGLIGGLGDDDHTQYVLADGTRNVTGNMTFDAEVEIDGNLNHDGTNAGFFSKAPVGQPTDVGALTDSSGGSTDGTVSAVAGTGDDATINDNFAELVAKVNGLRTRLRDLGLMA